MENIMLQFFLKSKFFIFDSTSVKCLSWQKKK